MISIQGVSKSFRPSGGGAPNHVLRDVSFHVPPSCLYGLIGPGASGKSILLKMIVGLLRPDTGSIVVGDRIILNSSRTAWGLVDMTETLARSLNVVTTQWALRLGKERFYDYLNRFGFGRVTGVDLSGEVYGLLKHPGSADWSMSDLGTNSFGQGMAVTPIQMINSVASMAREATPRSAIAPDRIGAQSISPKPEMASSVRGVSSRTIVSPLHNVSKRSTRSRAFTSRRSPDPSKSRPTTPLRPEKATTRSKARVPRSRRCFAPLTLRATRAARSPTSSARPRFAKT